MVTLPGCPVCDDSRSRHKYTKSSLPLVQCRGCGLVYANPRLTPEEIWQRYSRDYFWTEYLPAQGVQDGRFDLGFFDSRYAAMLRLIDTQVSDRGSLLEVGTGAGFFLKAAERAGWRVAGVELSPDAATFATDQLHLDVRRESAETMTFPPASFDVAVMFDVIEHLLDPALSLRHVRAALRPGGLLVVSTPNVNALTRFALGVNWAVLSPAEHLYNFSAATLTRLIERGGFGRVTLNRTFDGLGVFETMNPRYTHAPESMRARTYLALVSSVGRLGYRPVQRWGLADSLLALAFAPSV